jgi:hypothetical protein
MSQSSGRKQKGDQAMTQTTKHTPGPWQDNDAGLIYGQVSGDDDEAPFICDVCDNQPDYTEREKANPRLITAAPEMLALLKRINEAFYVKGTHTALLPVMAETKPLIAKAEGRA